MRRNGFTYIEVLVALGIFLVAVSAALSFFVYMGKAISTESSTLAAQQSGRTVVDELARTVQQVGYGIERSVPYDPAAWQASLVHAGSHVLAFNADIDGSVGPIPDTVSIVFPSGPSYTGEGPVTTTTGAETYVYTLDVDDNDAIQNVDRTAAATGSYNPAADTENPFDFALVRRVHGYNGSDYGGRLDPIAGHLFTNATTDADFPDGTSPAPLFTYWLSEDLNQDRRLSDVECVNDVVDTCPPSAEREPLPYLWGDSDFDGALSEAEKDALRGLEVGSPSWSKNPLVDAGSYKSTTTVAAVDPTSITAYRLEVADGTKLGPGYHVRLGSGSTAELLYVEQVATTSIPHVAIVSTNPQFSHAIGETIAVLPSTILGAVRTVGITFTSITDKRDSDNGAAAIGRLGRRGTRGLDYRVTPYQRKVELINAGTVALAQP